MADEDLVKIVVDLPNHWATGGEGLWARDLGGDQYEIDNVPFYAYGLNYRDVVRAVADDPSLKPRVKAVIQKSGHRTLRIIFPGDLNEDEQQPYLDQIRTFGASLERAHTTYLAIDIPPEGSYEELAMYLASLERREVLSYETCEEQVPGGFDAEPEPEEHLVDDGAMEMSDQVVTMFRPTGPQELELVAKLDWKRWPPRLPGQPIFYPVTNQNYAEQIARDWNVPESGAGFVTRFNVRKQFVDRFEIHQVGGGEHTEWWIPAEELEELNDNIVGRIEVVATFPTTGTEQSP